MKKAITILFIVFLTVLTPINGLMSVYGAGSDEWQNSDLSMQAKAFLYYCKSNNVVLEGSALDALTSFTTDTYYKICNQIGINPTELQSEIKNFTSDNLGLRFLFSNTGMTAMNRIFSQFLQNNDLSVSQQDVDKTIYQGKYFTDSEGRKVAIYICKKTINSYWDTNDNYFSQLGSVYRFDNADLFALWDTYAGGNTPTYTINGLEYYFSCGSKSNSGWLYMTGTPLNGTVCAYRSGGTVQGYKGSIGIFLDSNGLYLGSYLTDPSTGKHKANAVLSLTGQNNVSDEDVKVISPFIQNNNYTTNNNTTVNYITINNEGDVNYYYDDDEPGTTPPKPQDPSDDPSWQPVDPVIPPNNPDQGDNTIIDLPDIDIPDLPSLDFSLGDLRNKFPFSIPFDIISLLSVLDGEPQAPVIDAHIPFGTWFDWHFEADFSRFDDTAALIRSVEFIGFCIGLIYITIRLVKG